MKQPVGRIAVEGKHIVRDFRLGTATTRVLRDISLQVMKGEFVSIMGPSGSGKSTLLYILGGLDNPTSGCVLLDGTDISRLGDEQMSRIRRQKIGFVFQFYNLIPNLSAEENIMLPLLLDGKKMGSCQKQLDQILEVVGLSGHRKHTPRQLSGGQQQRVALARAFVIEPGVLLMDEPLSNLDAKLRVQMRTAIKKLQRRLGITTIYVTHDQEEALAISDRIAVMKEGNIMQVGTPEAIYKKPENTFVAGFIGVSNFVECEVDGKNPEAAVLNVKDECSITCKLKKPFTGKGIISARPEQLFFDKENGLPGRIVMSTFLGDFIEYEIELNNGQTLQLNEYTKDVQMVRPDGEQVKVNFDINAVGVYDAATQEVISW